MPQGATATAGAIFRTNPASTVPGPNFDEERVRVLGGEPLDQGAPADGGRQLLEAETLGGLGVAHRRGGDIGIHRVRRRGKTRVGDRRGEPRRRRPHERGVKGATHRQAHGTLPAHLLAERHRPLDAGHLAGDDDLPRGVVVGGDHHPALGVRASALAHRLDRFAQVAEDRRHRAGARLARLLHEGPAGAHEAYGIGEGERAGGVVGGKLT